MAVWNMSTWQQISAAASKLDTKLNMSFLFAGGIECVSKGGERTKLRTRMRTQEKVAMVVLVFVGWLMLCGDFGAGAV